MGDEIPRTCSPVQTGPQSSGNVVVFFSRSFSLSQFTFLSLLINDFSDEFHAVCSDSSAEGGGSPREVEYYGGSSRLQQQHQQQQQQQQQQHQHYQQHQQHEGSRGQQGASQLNPFDMDLGVRSNRSSVVSQDQVH